MNKIKHRLPLVLLFSKILIIIFALKAKAQEPTFNLHQHLADHAKSPDATSTQTLQLQHLK